MKSRIRRTTKQLILSLAALIVFATAHITAQADEVMINGFTGGCFGMDCPPLSTATLGGLSFSGSTLNGTTAGGFRGFGANANPGSNVNNLGSFSLSDVAQDYNDRFTFMVFFHAPEGALYKFFGASVTGAVTRSDIGGVFIDFGNFPAQFFFFDPNCEPDPTGGIPGQQTTCGVGAFLFSVNDVAINPGSIVPLTGQITRANQQYPFPEPATLLLLGTGLTGVAARLRRRAKNKAKEKAL